MLVEDTPSSDPMDSNLRSFFLHAIPSLASYFPVQPRKKATNPESTPASVLDYRYVDCEVHMK